MEVWLMHLGELLPPDRPFRPFRYTWLANRLVASGHRVVRWAPTFVHALKRYRGRADERVAVSEGYALELVHVRGYRRNVGLGRLRFNAALAWRCRRRLRERASPHVIVAAIPSPELAWVAAEFGRERGVPVIVDVRDLWPDVMLQAAPRMLRPLLRPALLPWDLLNRQTLRRAAAMVAVSQSYLDWGLRRAGRESRATDGVFPIGCDDLKSGAAGSAGGEGLLPGGGGDDHELVCCFAGQFERSYDLETVIEAARCLWTGGGRGIRFVLCGHGSKLAALKKRARQIGNVTFLGWVGSDTLAAVMSRADVGLACYSRDALQSIPNKVPEYMSAGLAVVSSLAGEAADLLASSASGITYRAGDARMLASVLVSLRDEPDRLQLMRHNARYLFEQQFRVSDIYSRMVTFIEAVGQR